VAGSGPSEHERVAVATQTHRVEVGPLHLPGELTQVPQPVGIVIFAHGSGSSRLSPRNRFVADVMHGYRLDTLLFDLLTETEAGDRRNTFDIPLLGERLAQALQWQRADVQVGRLRVGLFGASTGAAAALQAAAQHPAWVAAVVSRGGRPDLADAALMRVQAPTLLIVGGSDTEVLQLNRAATRTLRCATRLEVVPGATHLFEEPGAIETVAHLAGSWFATHVPAGGHR
jgi:pimeloyl-ACP methyl ester carboxylesterase